LPGVGIISYSTLKADAKGNRRAGPPVLTRSILVYKRCTGKSLPVLPVLPVGGYKVRRNNTNFLLTGLTGCYLLGIPPLKPGRKNRRTRMSFVLTGKAGKDRKDFIRFYSFDPICQWGCGHAAAPLGGAPAAWVRGTRPTAAGLILFPLQSQGSQIAAGAVV
jgi:hypothetical protein